MISRIIKAEAREASLNTFAETLIIPDISKTEFKYCFIIHCFMENIQKLLCEMQIDFIK